MSKLSATSLPVGPFNLYGSSTKAEAAAALGSIQGTVDGREYRLALTSGTSIAAGMLLQGPAQDTTNYQSLNVDAAPITTFTANAQVQPTVTVTTSVTVTENALAGGLMTVSSGTGKGYTYKIASNTGASSAGFVITLDDPILAALDTTSVITVQPNPYNGVKVMPTTATSNPVGASVWNYPANTYVWIQTKGEIGLRADGTIAVGEAVMPSTTTAGDVTPSTGTGAAVVGFAATVGASADYGLVDLIL